ncbi:hypothetical protein BPOR_1045g00050 [Botrytis porri]|uniref:Uncharacterized protein n=1 Tax=Botrytis porri TaxID=87229 RepID=A0A4Z1KC01_9HELO|nr:hypothetical protein BPOR_1045g00050 [Botrytis porri]
MNNPQTFNIINPNRGSHQVYYESVDSRSIWRRCLQYRPRVKDLKVLNPHRDKTRQMPWFLRKLRCRSPGGVRSKQASLFRSFRIREGRADISVEDQLLAPNQLLPIQHPAKILDPAPQKACVETSKLETIVGDPATGRVLSPVYNANYGPYETYTPSNSNHEIGMALTTPQTILNYSSSQEDTRNNNVQKRSDRDTCGDARSNGTSSWGILQIEEVAKGTELVDISTLVPAYLQAKRRLVANKIPADEVEHQPLPLSASTKNLVQLLEIEASRQEQEQEKEEMENINHHNGSLREPRKPRDSRRRGQVWNSEETRKSFLAIEALDAVAFG